MSNTADDYYALLGISSNANSDEIKKSYKKLCLKYHPDKTSDKSHHELFIKIREAYEVLKSPESRQSYDLSNNVNGKNGFATSGQTYSSSTTYSSSHFTSQQRPGYYNFYKYFYSHQNDSYEEQLRQERQRAHDADMQAKRRQEEIFKKKREEILRREREDLSKREKEKASEEVQYGDRNKDKVYAERKREAYRKQWEPSFNPLDPDDELSDIHSPKRSATDYNAYSSPISPNEYSFRGSDSNNPIVVEEEEIEEDGVLSPNTSSSGISSENKGSESFKSAKSKSDESFVSAGASSAASSNSGGVKVETVEDEDMKYKEFDEIFNPGVNIKPRSNRSRLYDRRKSLSPVRRSAYQRTSNERSEGSEGSAQAQNKAKKMKTETNDEFGLKGLKDFLGTDLEDVNFQDIFDTLPTENYKDDNDRKEDTVNLKANKRVKLSEYTDGTSKADTLFIPVNKKSFISNPLISNLKEDKAKSFSVLDLHASPKIHNCTAPTPPPSLLDNGVTEEQWLSYVKKIKKYQKNFLKYKRLIIQYQYERLLKDEEHFSLVNSNSSCFEVYQKSLERDVEVMQKFSDSLKVFTNTMIIYKQNCNWVKIARENGIWPQ